MKAKNIAKHQVEHQILGIDKKIRKAMFLGGGGGGAVNGIGLETDPIHTAWLAGPPNVSEFVNDAGYLTAETDPIVGLISGIVKADGAGVISAAAEGTDYSLISTVAALPVPAVSGQLVKLTTDKRIYFGLET